MECATAALIIIATAMIDENRHAFGDVESAGSAVLVDAVLPSCSSDTGRYGRP
jgi:hypothetical protein